MPKISVIMPVYNTGVIVKSCLESLFEQSFKDFEIIIINDGSTDGSGDIIKNTIAGRADCKYFYQENKGQSAARNLGLAVATGEYVAFVDSDDWVEKDYLEVLLNGIEKYGADIAQCGYCRIYKDDYDHGHDHAIIFQVSPGEGCTVITDENTLLDFYYKTFVEAKYGHLCWNKLYRRSLIEQLSLRFADTQEIYAEDILFNTNLILFAKKVVEIAAVQYNYRLRKGSITQSYKPLLEKRYAELMRRIEPLVQLRLPVLYPEFMALMQYETINVIVANSYNFTKSPGHVCSALNKYDGAGGRVVERLKYLNKARKRLNFKKKEMGMFFFLLGNAARLGHNFTLGLLYWLKLYIVEKRKDNGKITVPGR
jgi:glycosyltransferase involved in cell wall biosynthesis